MKMTIEIDCTPIEARSFLGLPDVTPLNDALVSEMKNRLSENMAAMGPEAMMKNWAEFGTQATDQFRKMMMTAMGPTAKS
jgi:hypothetical protein